MRDAEPASRVNPVRVRRHIDELKARGWTLSGIARAAGVNRTTVDRIAHGHLEHCSRITARLILAVEP
jgi:transcriptional regulator with XRE-family HTH domain